MLDRSFTLADPLLQGSVPRTARCAAKVLISLLVGLGLAILLTLVLGSGEIRQQPVITVVSALAADAASRPRLARSWVRGWCSTWNVFGWCSSDAESRALVGVKAVRISIDQQAMLPIWRGIDGESTDETFIEKHICANDLVVFTSSDCPLCSCAVDSLKAAGYSPSVIELQRGQQQVLAAKCGSQSLPAVFAKTHYIGGCYGGGMGGVLPLLENGRLTELMTQATLAVESMQPLWHVGRRGALLAGMGAAAVFADVPRPTFADELPVGKLPSVTEKVFLEVSQCAQGSANAPRIAGQTGPNCLEPQPLGRIVIGVFGDWVPNTANDFVTLCKAGTYKNTAFSRVLPGEFISAGRQGKDILGEVKRVPSDLLPKSNPDVIKAQSFSLPHFFPGTVSLAIGANDDPGIAKERPGYRSIQFLITTGPAPVASLDGENIVFGTVLEGLNLVQEISQVPTYKPSQTLQSYNAFAEEIGDKRAEQARVTWARPRDAIVISNTGVLQDAKSPSGAASSKRTVA